MSIKEHVKVIRFDNEGFMCKPYTSPTFHHVFEFIDTEIQDLNVVKQSIEESKLHKPKLNDWNWSGCFCFLEEYNKKIRETALSMRISDKRNISYLPISEVIWVRNTSHLGIDHPYYSKFMYYLLHEGEKHWFFNVSTYDSLRWVKMRVDLALERTRLWKELNPNSPTPEWLTEFYLLEEKKNKLMTPSFKDRAINLGVNLGWLK